MTTPATASFLREATSPEALTCARRRLLTAHPDPTRANTPTPGSLTDEQLRPSPRATGRRHASPHLTRTRSRRPIPSPGRSWPNRCAKPSNGDSPRNAPTAPTMTRAQDTTHLTGESSTTTTTATTTSREPPSASPTRAS